MRAWPKATAYRHPEYDDARFYRLDQPDDLAWLATFGVS
jgi:hypothetical protein